MRRIARENSSLADAEPEPEAPARTKRGKGKPPVPAWEDVLLGVRSSGER